MLRGLFIFILIVVATTGSSETYTEKYSRGNWILYHVEGMKIRSPNGRYEPIEKLCLAAYISPKASLKFYMAPGDIVAQKPYLRNFVLVQAAAEKWNYRRRKAHAGLSVKVLVIHSNKAQYEGFAITFGITDFKVLRVLLTFAGSSETIDVIDSRQKVIARFPTNGFSDIRDRLFACAGV